ncbi:MAG: tyrosine recombinase XerC [Ruminococcaceae bacterium]|nr:tyrosine recombinase XerC [Oscillospiraceae bacterium]
MVEKTFLNEFPPLIREFAAYKLTIQACSEKTVNEYLLDLRTFCRYLIAEAENIPKDGKEFGEIDMTGLDAAFFESITTSQIYEFLYYTDKERGNENKAKARKLSAIKSFYKYLTVKQKLFDNNPAITIETPKQKKQLPKHLTVEESLSLLNAVRTDSESKTKERDYAILTLFLNCGMRLSELAGISLPDLDPELRSLRVLGKGAKERIIYLNDACRDALNVYLPIRTSTPTKGDNALFLSSRAQRISVKTVQWMVYKYLKAAGLENRHYSTHKLRHTAATLMYQTGKVDIRVLKDILGHEQLNTTQIYTHISDRGMEDAMQKNPLAEVKAPKHLPSAKKDSEEN